MPTTIGWLIGILTLAGGAALFPRAQPARRPWMVIGLLAVAAGLVAAASAQSFLLGTDADWNSVRTAIPYALTKGVPLYFPQGMGPLWCSSYPPVGQLLYTPVALGSSPSSAIHIGQALSVLWMLVGFAAITWRAVPTAPTPTRVLHTLLGLTLGFGAVLLLKPLADVTFYVHIDAPAIGLSLLAVAVLLHPTDTRSRPKLWLAALLLVTSAACKQSQITLPIAVLAWVAIHGGKRKTGEMVLALIAWGGSAAGLAFALCNPAGMWHNNVVTQSHHGFIGGFWGALAFERASLLRWLGWVALVGPAATAWVHRSRAALLASPQALLLACGLVQVPISIAGFLKFGGGPNHLALAGTFFAAAAIVSALQSLPATEATPLRRSLICLPIAMLIASTVGAGLVLHEQRHVGVANQHDIAASLIHAHPGQYYFPWLPLSHYMAEGRLTHHSWGILDRVMAGETPSEAWLRQYTPPAARYLCIERPPDKWDMSYQALKNDFPLRYTLPELTDYSTFVRPESTLPSPATP